jgi:hypothetical protein
MDELVEKWVDIYMHLPALQRDWFMITGNHDYDPPSLATAQLAFATSDLNINQGGHWKMPAFWYKQSFQTASGVTVDTFFIDTMIWLGRAQDGDLRSESQRVWLEGELSNSNADWKFVFGHHAIYTWGNQVSERTLFNELDTMMRMHGVQAFFSGHSHNKQLIQHRGLNYVVSGSGGGVADEQQDNYPEGTLQHLGLNLGFVGLSICESSQATLTYYMADGEVDETFTLTGDRPEAEPDSSRCMISSC